MRNLRQHRAFTLIELLVTIALIIVLLSIAVAVSNSATLDSYKLNGAADRLGQALLTAKSRAARDKAPRGIRLVAGTDGYIRELYYIEQPDPWLPGQIASIATSQSTPSDVNRSQFVIRYQYTPVNPPNATQTAISVPTNCHAYLLLTAGDAPRFLDDIKSGKISAGAIVSSPDLNAGVMIPASFFNSVFSNPSNPQLPLATLDSAAIPSGMVVVDLMILQMTSPDLAAGFTDLSATNTNVKNRATFQTTAFGIYPSPQPLAGEPTLILSKNVAVDPAASLINATAGQNIDILFAPDGHVMFRSEGVIAFVVRDTFKFTPAPPVTFGYSWLTDPSVSQTNYRGAGEMVLVSLYPRTGTVATKPVAEPDGTPTTDPYKFAKDAINSGL
jgi:prepilin-type N-terminal cleavage/methylation domain-containing protein